MKTYHYLLLLACGCALTFCNQPKEQEQEVSSTPVENDDPVLFSFAFVGCNRVDWTDRDNDTATNGSTANLAVLERIFSELSVLERKSELFFFLGDMVLAESTTENLDNQLTDWITLYNDTSFSKMSESAIEMVAIPGNHEMLYYKDYNIPDHDEWPLKGATEIWMKHMSQFMPEEREHVTGTDSIANQMTFSFVRHNVGFVLMNTDTYNEPTSENPYGVEGMIPTQWIIDKVNEYQQDPNVDHVFVLGHKPYYVSGEPQTGHVGLPEGPVLWPKLKEAHVVAMLSAHYHDYQRMQPEGEGTYQVIAGNGGSKGTATFFGYTTINILKNGEVELISHGFDLGDKYYEAAPNQPITVRDSTRLTWSTNSNPYEITQ